MDPSLLGKSAEQIFAFPAGADSGVRHFRDHHVNKGDPLPLPVGPDEPVIVHRDFQARVVRADMIEHIAADQHSLVWGCRLKGGLERPSPRRKAM